MKHTEFSFIASDKVLTYAQTWQPENNLPLKGAVCLIHGLGEHGGRYEHVARFFADNGYATLAVDLRGHGRSEGKRGHIKNWQILHDIISQGLAQCGQRFGVNSPFLYGHSMGGNLVINYVLQQLPNIKGCIVTAPWLEIVQPVPAIKIILSKFVNKILGAHTEKNDIDTNNLSRDAQIVAAYNNDKLVHDKISVRLFVEASKSAVYNLSNAPKLKTPMLLMHGTADKITSYTASERFAKNAPPHLLTFKPWPNYYHEIHNEPNEDKWAVLQTMLGWMEEI
ncbi:MAG: alpha/beta hydrolase [Sphingobacteriales bacterium]|nr:alpha/beta hydrolase [Sphingobacteriales bacterium]MBP9140282.1 lysophospholipase [Chitinophagales bacterium]MDA0197191.1 lysophospholipase [Bacteroidota bacterium]MBK6891436.1 alpha/beta hydrolase [Sphingobacteriales bacterium]MBK7526732.1 alpha/beta hydrolase [Sphingobacteriales bacterium]